MYEVITPFIDSKNGNHLYGVGHIYPADNYKPTKKLIEELVKGTNKNGKVYLKEVKASAQTSTSDTVTDDTTNITEGSAEE